jgi:hypothetical protein
VDHQGFLFCRADGVKLDVDAKAQGKGWLTGKYMGKHAVSGVKIPGGFPQVRGISQQNGNQTARQKLFDIRFQAVFLLCVLRIAFIITQFGKKEKGEVENSFGYFCKSSCFS